jgi:hypothetical protein
MRSCFCREIVDAMVASYGITRPDAVARVNRQWQIPGRGHPPRVWIVGLDLVYHETAVHWAEHIYHGHGTH